MTRNRIREIRLGKRMTQIELAKAANVSQPYLHDLEAQARKGKPETLERIAEALGVTVSELTGKEVASA